MREGVEAPLRRPRGGRPSGWTFWAALAEDQGRAVGLALPAGPCPVRRQPRPTSRRRWTRCSATSCRTRRTAPAFAVSLAPAGRRGAAAGGRRRGPGLRRRAAVRGRGDSRRRVDRAGAGHRAAHGGRLRRRPDDRAQSATGGARVTMRLGPPTSAPGDRSEAQQRASERQQRVDRDGEEQQRQVGDRAVEEPHRPGLDRASVARRGLAAGRRSRRCASTRNAAPSTTAATP